MQLRHDRRAQPVSLAFVPPIMQSRVCLVCHVLGAEGLCLWRFCPTGVGPQLGRWGESVGAAVGLRV